jgi:hypothetical protein
MNVASPDHVTHQLVGIDSHLASYQFNEDSPPNSSIDVFTETTSDATN